ncbi:MAG: 3-oxoacyl-[acyl-carrier-protein] synthase 3 [Syntrophus sp. SKADARSKE-3]|nr:3-oxoacyl-[acyl-carrier-protein] synthase 3 [Syntrophus sp. SKADARSKE-3]
MGTKIKSVNIAHEGFFRRGSVELESKAAEECLKSGGVDPSDIGILINTGVYRDRHLVEPAMSSFIQKNIGANVSGGGKRSTFSFDLTNGGGGMLTGIMVADGFLQSGLTNCAMVVAGDAESVPGLSDGYDYDPAASAVLLVPGEDGEGFIAFRTVTDTRYLDAAWGRMIWQGEKKKQNWLVLRSDPDYAVKCANSAMTTLEAFLTDMDMALTDIDLLIPSQDPRGWLVEMRKRTGLGEKIVDVTATYGNVHTAGLGMALYRAEVEGRFARKRNVVFLTVGAGITVTVALYRNIY